MIKLTVGNSFSRIVGLSPPQEAVLRKALSFKIQDPRGYNFHHTTRYLIDKRGNFPTGLLSFAISSLGDVEIAEFTDNRIIPARTTKLFNLTLPFEPYKEQREAAMAAVTAHQGTVVMPTASGKSVTMALLLQALQVKTLIVVPNVTLKRQLRASFLEYFGSLDNITIENIDSPNLKKAEHYDCLIIDEAHHVAARTYRDLNKKAWGGIYYRFFFTATPFRGQEEEQILMESITGEVAYTLTYKAAIEAKMITPIEAYYIELPKVKVKGQTWAAVYKELVTDREDRNHILREWAKSLHLKRASALILVKEIAHGNRLTLDGAFAFANGKDENTETYINQFSSGERKVLIATTGVAGEGTDTRACEYVFIAGLGKSKPQFMQQVGRALRRFPGKDSAKVILLLDPSHRWTKSHFKEQCKILREEFGVEPVRLEL